VGAAVALRGRLDLRPRLLRPVAVHDHLALALALRDAGRGRVLFQPAVRLVARNDLSGSPLGLGGVAVLARAAQPLERPEKSAGRLTLGHRSPPA